MDNISELVFLFLSAFLAATIFPAQSEMVLVGLHMAGSHHVPALLVVATFGNVLGALLNWVLGRYFIHFRDKEWFPVKQTAINKATQHYKKWGVWTLLFAWVPLIGDVLTLVSGIFRVNIFLFLILVTIGKAARYMVILAVV